MAGKVEQKELAKGFVLAFETPRGELVDLEFINAHHAEEVLRGLVHGGYTVTISEQLVILPESLKALRDWEKQQYHRDFDREMEVGTPLGTCR